MKILKRNCPCPKCEKWRKDRYAKKLKKAMEESFSRMLVSVGATVSFENPQTLPKPAKTPDLL